MNGFLRSKGGPTLFFLLALLAWSSMCFGAEDIFSLPGAKAGGASEPPNQRYRAGEVLVKFKPGISADAIKQIGGHHPTSHLRTLRDTKTQVWQVPDGREADIVARLAGRPDVEFAEPNYIYRMFAIPDDPDFSRQWAHQYVIDSSSAWNVTTGSTDIVIAVVDSGIDAQHPDLSGRIVAGYDFVDNDGLPDDENGHGTHVAGIAAAVTNNHLGIAGMDWNARIMPVKVLNYYGSGAASEVSAGIAWAHAHGALVINLSLGGEEYSAAVQDAIDDAHDAGCLVVSAMGNDRSANPTHYPAACDNVFAVAATTRTDTHAYYSQYGSHCDIAAPGGQMGYIHDPYGIYSAMPTVAGTYFTGGEFSFSTGYDYLQGTSMAAPFVSGLAALIWSLKPAWAPVQVQAAIETTAVDLGAVGWDEDFGNGRIDAGAALAAIADDCFGDSEGEDRDVDGIDLAIWASAHAITLTDANMSAFGAAFGTLGCQTPLLP